MICGNRWFRGWYNSVAGGLVAVDVCRYSFWPIRICHVLGLSIGASVKLSAYNFDWLCSVGELQRFVVLALLGVFMILAVLSGATRFPFCLFLPLVDVFVAFASMTPQNRGTRAQCGQSCRPLVRKLYHRTGRNVTVDQF